MKRTLLMLTLLLAMTVAASAQRPDEHEGMTHTATSLFVARMDGRAVVPASGSGATGTGAFVLEVKGREARLDYHLTFDSLRNGPPRAIRLRNFSAGGNGEVVHVVCGAPEGAAACPDSPGGTVSGAWTSGDAHPLTPELARELAAQRVYAEVESGTAGAREVRGQLSSPPFMAITRSFVAKLSASGAPGVSGTGAFSLVIIDEQRRLLLFDVTVTGLQAPITGFSITLPGASGDTAFQLQVKADARKSSATISGTVSARELPLLLKDDALRLMTEGQLFLRVFTSDRRVGELRSPFTPLR